MRKQRFLNILKYLKLPLLVPFVFLLIIHFLVKDRNLFFATIFNISPVPILISIGLVLSIILYRDKKVYKLVLTITILLICHWIYSYYGFKEVTINKGDTSIVLWNIDNSESLPLDNIDQKIKTYSPEIMAFLEAKNIGTNKLKYLKKKYPDYTFTVLQGYMLLATKGNAKHIEYTKLKTISKYHLLETSIKGKIKRILLTDIAVFKSRNRWQDLKTVLNYALEHKADIILGDFNTPYESMHFNGFKDNYQSFHDVSEGFAATWPKGLPLLELDQIWVTPEIEPISLKKFYLKEYSNHDMLIGSFKFKN